MTVALHARFAKQVPVWAVSVVNSAHDCCRALLFSSAVVVHGDVHEDAAFQGLEAHHSSFCLLVAAESLFGCVNLWRRDLKAKSLIVEAGDCISDHHVGEL